VIERADALAGFKKGAFQAKIRDLGIRLTHSVSVSVRCQLFGIFVENPLTFMNSDQYLGRSLKALSEDPEIAVRCRFVQDFHLLYSKSPNPEFRDRLFTWLLPAFSSGEAPMNDALIRNRVIYRVIGPAKIAAILPHFLRIFQGCNRWRTVVAALSLLADFPREPMRPFWMQAWAILAGHLQRSPCTLRNITVTFIAAGCSVCPHADIAARMEDDLRESPSHQLRRFYIQVVIGIMMLVELDLFLDVLWPGVVSLVEDPVASVRVALLQSLIHFRRFFVELSLVEPSQLIDGVISILGQDEDPFVRDVWAQVSQKVLALEPRGRIDLGRKPNKPTGNLSASCGLQLRPSLFDSTRRRVASGGQPLVQPASSLLRLERVKKTTAPVQATSQLSLAYLRPKVKI
jgi:hypothetical protein